jgi:hypothetical protein
LNSQQVSLVAPCCEAACLDLQEAGAGLLSAALSAAAYFQAALLTPIHLAPDSFAHKVLSDSKQVVLLWRYCHELVTRLAKTFDGMKPMALLLLLQLLTAAATAAIDMHKKAAVAAAASAAAAAAAAAADSDSSSSSDGGGRRSSRSSSRRCHRRSGSNVSNLSFGFISGPRSALGDISAASDSSDDEELHTPPDESSLGTSGCPRPTWPPAAADRRVLRGRVPQGLGELFEGFSPVCDEVVQSQAWLPHVLHGLLHYAGSAAKQVRVCCYMTCSHQYHGYHRDTSAFWECYEAHVDAAMLAGQSTVHGQCMYSVAVTVSSDRYIKLASS